MRITAPSHTQTPNDLFDHWIPLLNESELKTLLVIIRKTFGWHKVHDRISLSQLERLTGLSETSILGAIKSLTQKGVIKKITIGKIGTQQTFYELVVEENSNISDPPSKWGGPPQQVGGGTPPVSGDTKETLFTKETTATKKAATPRAAASFQKPVFKIHQCLDVIDIPEEDKVEISTRHAIERVEHAIKWATHPKTKINKSLAAAIKWACLNNPELPKEKKNNQEENMKYAMKYNGDINGSYKISVEKKYIEIDYGTPYKENFTLHFTDDNFINRLNDALKRGGFILK